MYFGHILLQKPDLCEILQLKHRIHHDFSAKKKKKTFSRNFRMPNYSHDMNAYVSIGLRFNDVIHSEF